jgi:ABC transporter substrate binding protein
MRKFSIARRHIPVWSDWKLAYAPKAAQAEIVPSNHEPDVCSWHTLPFSQRKCRVQQLVSLAARHKMPAMYYRREFADAGGLASYGTSVIDAYRQAGVYVARVLKGDKPGELPVMQAAKFEFVLNLKTARALGIDVPMAFSVSTTDCRDLLQTSYASR